MKKFRIGVLGLSRGAAYVQTYASQCGEAELCVVCDTNPAALNGIKSRLPDSVKCFDDYDAFLDSGLDAVVLANWFHEHAKYAIPALERGIAVLSETTAAPTLGDCVKLCEAAEKGGAKYMLAANVPMMYGCGELDRLYGEGSFGRVLYAEGEYFHADAPGNFDSIMPGEYHWRRWLPRTYYNMHDLGTLMSITKSVPKKVSAKAVFAPDVMEKEKLFNTGDVSSVILTETDSGAIFRTTSWSNLGPTGKWFRLACENGTIETVRGDQDSVMYTYNPWSKPEGAPVTASYDARPKTVGEAEKNAGHGGSDYLLCLKFVDYLAGRITPFFDVYRSVALSAAGILAWYSVLDGGKEYEVPDFADKASRDTVARDFRTPFPKPDGSGITLDCSSKPYHRPV